MKGGITSGIVYPPLVLELARRYRFRSIGGTIGLAIFGTVLNNQFWSVDPTQPMANLTVTIYQYANTPYPDLQLKAWGASLLIIVGVLGANLLVRLIAQRGRQW